MKGRRTLTEAAVMIEHRQSSGLSVHAFCASENINPATYYYWQQRLRMNESRETPMLIPISIEKPGQRNVINLANLELLYPNGVRLSVPQGSEINMIRELILIL